MTHPPPVKPKRKVLLFEIYHFDLPTPTVLFMMKSTSKGTDSPISKKFLISYETVKFPVSVARSHMSPPGRRGQTGFLIGDSRQIFCVKRRKHFVHSKILQNQCLRSYFSCIEHQEHILFTLNELKQPAAGEIFLRLTPENVQESTFWGG